MVPALVAVLATLLIEFFAKPYLEVRKERLLRAARRRWELVEAIRALEERIHLLGFLVGEGAADLLTIEKVIADLARDIDRAEELSIGLEEELPDPIVLEMYAATGFYGSTVDRLRASSRHPEEDRNLRIQLGTQGRGEDLRTARHLSPHTKVEGAPPAEACEARRGRAGRASSTRGRARALID